MFWYSYDIFFSNDERPKPSNAIGTMLVIFNMERRSLLYDFHACIMCFSFRRVLFYNGKKGAKPLRWLGMGSIVFIADYYYVQPILTTHQMLGNIILLC